MQVWVLGRAAGPLRQPDGGARCKQQNRLRHQASRASAWRVTAADLLLAVLAGRALAVEVLGHLYTARLEQAMQVRAPACEDTCNPTRVCLASERVERSLRVRACVGILRGHLQRNGRFTVVRGTCTTGRFTAVACVRAQGLPPRPARRQGGGAPARKRRRAAGRRQSSSEEEEEEEEEEGVEREVQVDLGAAGGAAPLALDEPFTPDPLQQRCASAVAWQALRPSRALWNAHANGGRPSAVHACVRTAVAHAGHLCRRPSPTAW